MASPMAASFTRPISSSIESGTLYSLVLKLALVLHQPLQAQRLDGEGHIHDLRRVAVAGGQVHQAAFAPPRSECGHRPGV